MEYNNEVKICVKEMPNEEINYNETFNQMNSSVVLKHLMMKIEGDEMYVNKIPSRL